MLFSHCCATAAGFLLCCCYFFFCFSRSFSIFLLIRGSYAFLFTSFSSFSITNSHLSRHTTYIYIFHIAVIFEHLLVIFFSSSSSSSWIHFCLFRKYNKIIWILNEQMWNEGKPQNHKSKESYRCTLYSVSFRLSAPNSRWFGNLRCVVHADSAFNELTQRTYNHNQNQTRYDKYPFFSLSHSWICWFWLFFLFSLSGFIFFLRSFVIILYLSSAVAATVAVLICYHLAHIYLCSFVRQLARSMCDVYTNVSRFFLLFRCSHNDVRMNKRATASEHMNIHNHHCGFQIH